MYQYKDGNVDFTIILRYVTRVFYDNVTSTFGVYLIGKGEPYMVPTKYYDDFMDKLSSYVKSQAQ